MTTNDIINPANLVYAKPSVLNDVPMHYCPGCTHGVIHKLIGEIIGLLQSPAQRVISALQNQFANTEEEVA